MCLLVRTPMTQRSRPAFRPPLDQERISSSRRWAIVIICIILHLASRFAVICNTFCICLPDLSFATLSASVFQICCYLQHFPPWLKSASPEAAVGRLAGRPAGRLAAARRRRSVVLRRPFLPFCDREKAT